jgi:hypothetical protein
MATTTKSKNATSTSRNTFSDNQKTLTTHKVQHGVFLYDSAGTGRILSREFMIQSECGTAA